MPDYRQDLQFGVFIPPVAGQADGVLELARLADVVGLDIVSFQDHPYQPSFLDTWTLLSVVAAETTNVRVAPNVANLPLRPPVVLARSAASLDILSGGRVELGLGAGAFWDAIAAKGGPSLTPGQSVDALAEAIDVIRAIWNADGEPVRHAGRYYTVDGAQPGPPPVHDIEIWLGAYKPRMLHLTGAKADGWVPSLAYLELEQLPDMNAAIDEAATNAGRRPEADPAAAQHQRQLRQRERLPPGPAAAVGRAADAADAVDRNERVHPLGRRQPTTCGALRRRSRPRHGSRSRTRAARPIASRRLARSSPNPGPARGPAGPGARNASARSAHGTRPRGRPGPTPDPSRTYTAREQAAGQHLIDVHDALRGELAQLRDLVEQVAAGTTQIRPPCGRSSTA